MNIYPLRKFLRPALAAAVGAVVLVCAGFALREAGGTCGILCRPPVAAMYGAVMGLLLVPPSKKAS